MKKSLSVVCSEVRRELSLDVAEDIAAYNAPAECASLAFDAQIRRLQRIIADAGFASPAEYDQAVIDRIGADAGYRFNLLVADLIDDHQFNSSFRRPPYRYGFAY
jgi:hypothetical protein